MLSREKHLFARIFFSQESPSKVTQKKKKTNDGYGEKKHFWVI